MKKSIMTGKCILAGALILFLQTIYGPALSGGAAGAAEIIVGIGEGTKQGGTPVTVPDDAEILPSAETGTEPDTDQDILTDAEWQTEEPYTENNWRLILVNATHPIPDDYVIPELTQLQNGNSIDSRVYPALQQMFDDARAQGIYPYVTSSYRTMEKQQQLMDDKIGEYTASGYSEEEARKLAEEWVAIPGTSEHQLGLSVDISADPASGQDAGSVWYWLKLYCWDYGFIIRYPEDKTQITGIINEPWHFRYVGKEAALEMKESGQCLEEYLGMTS